MKRRKFIKKTSVAGMVSVLSPYFGHALWLPSQSKTGLSKDGSVLQEGELLYNGIRLPTVWPPTNMNPDSRNPRPVPYLNTPPEVIPINIGRQLWVDDFLIKETTLTREFHLAEKYEGNPVFVPEKSWESDRNRPSTVPISGGIYWDPNARIFKMWYDASFIGSLSYAQSTDGINWERPNLGIIPGTNIIFERIRPGSTSVIFDHEAEDPSQRYKLFVRPAGGGAQPASVRVSADGFNWSEPKETGPVGDRSTMFYNPFRKKWIQSIRHSGTVLRSGIGRARYYLERDEFFENTMWTLQDPVFWTGSDNLDPADPVIGDNPQLYNLDAVAYESLILGVFMIHRGPHNDIGNATGIPKITELSLGFSRDGFHWHRPDRRPFIAATRQQDSWERGYLQPGGGGCLVVGDELWFYYGGFKGAEGVPEGTYHNGSTGLAKLRRDGFASLNATPSGGTVTTRKLTFTGRYLFVNVDCPEGELKAEILDETGAVITPFTLSNSEVISANKTCIRLNWNGADDLSAIAGREVSFRFHLRNGKFYSFWVSPDESGASYGYVGAGGPGLTGAIDTVGINADATLVSEIVSWRFSSPNTAGDELDYPSTYADSRVEPSLLTRGPGFIPGSTYARGFGGGSNSWNRDTNHPTSRATGEERDYFEFKVKGKEGYLSLNSIDFKYRRNNRGANTYQWSYSLNGSNRVYIGEVTTYTGEESDGLEQPTVDLSNITALKNLTPLDEVTFRLHLWGISGVTVSGVQYLGRYPGNDQTPSLVVKGVISESEITLPVTLLDFTARKEGNVVRLDWRTASETNNSRFEVLRSADGQHFDAIGTVTGKGTTSELTRYSFADFNPLLGTGYYKLRQIDFNEKVTDSEVKAVTFSMRKTSFSVWVSEEENTVNLHSHVEKGGNAEFMITDISGRKVAAYTLVLKSGENKLSFPVQLLKGVYVAHLTSMNGNQVTKFSKN